MFIIVELSIDSYIFAVPKRNDSYISAVPKEDEGYHLQSRIFRHKNLAFNDNTGDDDISDTTEDDKEVIIAPQALSLRGNRSKSTLDKLVREPELGRQNIHPFI